MTKLITRFLYISAICLFTYTVTVAAGVVDVSFGTNGTVVTAIGQNDVAKKLKIQNDGKILILGETFSNGSSDTVLVRYNSDGTLDTSFGTNGISRTIFPPSTGRLEDFTLQEDGKIVVAGNIFLAETQSHDFVVARFDPNGALDSTFGNNGVKTLNQSTFDELKTVIVQPDGKIFAVGRTSQNNYDFAAIRLNSDGSLDSGFGDGGFWFYDLGPFISQQVFRSADIMPNGRIVLGGTAVSNNSGVDVIMMLEPNGAFAQNFGLNGIVQQINISFSASTNFKVDALSDGKILVLSSYQFRRLLSNGTPDFSFRNAFFPLGSVNVAGNNFVVRPDGRIVVLGQGTFLISSAVAYAPNGREINRVRNLNGLDIAAQSDNKFVTLNSNTNGFSITRYVSISSPASRLADLDFDGKTDLLVLRGGATVWAKRSVQGLTTYPIFRNSGETVRILPEDFDTGNPDQFPLFYHRTSGPNSPTFFEGVTPNGSRTTNQWGISGDIPVGGDFDGEAVSFNAALFRRPSELTVFRPSTGVWWIFNRQTNTVSAINWGISGDKPVPADYDYDGITDFAVFRPSTGTWWIRRSSDGTFFTIVFGLPTDISLTGDFDGDGRADLTVYRPSEGNWYQFLTADGYRVVRFGLPTDFPVPGDYDGDGRHDIAVFRDGVWYILQSSLGLRIENWGIAGDVPVSIRYDQ